MITDYLESNKKILIFQRKELAELFGFETRNKYSIELESGQQIAFAAERSTGFFAFFGRQFFGHWRTFSIEVVDPIQNLLYVAHHPFRFFLRRLEIQKSNGESIGLIQQQFNFLYKKFDIFDENNNLLMKMSAPIWKIWTFPIWKQDQEVAVIQKKWSGVFKEAFTDADNFTVEFESQTLSLKDRELILFSALLIDIVFFERKSK